ncbi:MAG TPA: sigma-70 family RNA polymerase sigma factor, partial [Rhizomicrobium sp.]
GEVVPYRQLLAELATHLRSYYRRRLAAGADAEDLVQETLMALHVRRATYDAANPFTAWVYAIARYKLIDHLRRTRRARTIPLDDAGALFSPDETEAAGARIDAERLLLELPVHQREVLRKVKIEELSTAEVAKASAMSEAAVKTSVHRSLKALGAKLLVRKP